MIPEIRRTVVKVSESIRLAFSIQDGNEKAYATLEKFPHGWRVSHVGEFAATEIPAEHIASNPEWAAWVGGDKSRLERAEALLSRARDGASPYMRIQIDQFLSETSHASE